MTKYILILTTFIFMDSGYTQNKYEKAEGFYNLSSFEVASGVCLLKNKTFFYYASFGNVDLKIFGNYTIDDNNLLVFKPDKELMDEFYIYGAQNKIKNDSITLTYKKPFNNAFEKIQVNNIPLPEFTSEKNTVAITFKKTSSNFLTLTYGGNEPFEAQKKFSVPLTDEIDDLKLYHNYYADMVKKTQKNTFEVKKDVLIDEKQKSYKKNKIDEKTINEMILLIQHKRTNNTMDVKGKVYRKLNTNKLS